jgi:hypothetical protein
MIHHLGEILGMNRVKDIEKILTRWTFAGWVFVGEVLCELNILLELWPQVLNGELIIVRHRDLKYLSFLHEVLLARKHILQEVFIDDILIGQIVLYYRGIRH